MIKEGRRRGKPTFYKRELNKSINMHGGNRDSACKPLPARVLQPLKMEVALNIGEG